MAAHLCIDYLYMYIYDMNLYLYLFLHSQFLCDKKSSAAWYRDVGLTEL